MCPFFNISITRYKLSEIQIVEINFKRDQIVVHLYRYIDLIFLFLLSNIRGKIASNGYIGCLRF